MDLWTPRENKCGPGAARPVNELTTNQPEEFPVYTPPNTRDPSSDRTPWGSPTSQVEMQTFPWWPAIDDAGNQIEGVYLSATQLPDGRLSVIIDPGAWTNLITVAASLKS